MSQPSMVIRIAANVDELKRNLADGIATIDALGPAVEKMQDVWSANSVKIIQNAKNIVAAVAGFGDVTGMSTADAAKNLRVLDQAMAQLKQTGQTIPPEMLATADALRSLSPPAKEAGASLAMTVTGLIEAARAAKDAISEVVHIVGEWVTAFSAQEDATVRLETALRSQGTYTPQLSAQYDELASKYESTSVFADELVMSTEAMLVQIGGVMPNQMDAALKATTDLAAGLRIDLNTATMLIGKAFAGETGTLKRYGIVIDENTLKTQGASAVLDAIAAKMGGQAAAQAATFAGRIAQLNNQIDNAKETLGGLIATALTPLFAIFSALPGPVQTAIITLTLLGAVVLAGTVAFGGLTAAMAVALPLIGVAIPAGATAATIAMLALDAASAGFVAIFGVIAAVLASPITLIVALVAAGAGLLYWLGNVTGMTSAVGSIFRDLASIIGDVLGIAWHLLGDAVSWIGGKLSWMLPIVEALIYPYKLLAEGVKWAAGQIHDAAEVMGAAGDKIEDIAPQIDEVAIRAKLLPAAFKPAVDITKLLAESVTPWSVRISIATDELKRMDPAQRAYIASALQAGASTKDLSDETGRSADVMDLLKKQLDATKKANEDAAAAVKKHEETIASLRDKLGFGGLTSDTKNLIEAMEGMPPVAELSAKQQEALLKATSEAIDEYKAMKLAVPDAVQTVFNELSRLVTIPALMDKANKEALKIQTDYYDKLAALGSKANETEMKRVEGSLKVAVDITKQYGELFLTAKERAVETANEQRDKYLAAIEPLKTSAPAVWADMNKKVGVIYDAAVAAAAIKGQQVAESFGKNLSNYLENDLPKTIMSAITGGGNVLSSIGSSLGGFLVSKDGFGKQITSGLTSLLGAGLGTAVSSILPGLGALMGPLLSGIGDLFKNTGRASVEAYAQTMGGFESLHTQLAALGAAGEAYWIKLTQGTSKANPAEVKKITDEINAALGKQADHLKDLDGVLSKYNVSWADSPAAVQVSTIAASVQGLTHDYDLLIERGLTNEGATRAQASAYNDLLSQVIAAGGEIPPAMLPAIQSMAELGLVSEANMRKMLGLKDETTVDFKAMEDAANKYGINLKDLGPKFQQAKLNDIFTSLASDFGLLVQGGADMNAVLEKMGPQAQDAVNKAIAYGAQIPATMKPMLEAMAKAGTLTDENGNKLTDLSKLNFATPIEDSLKELVKLFKDFIDKIAASAAGISNIPRTVPIDIVYNDPGFRGASGSGSSDAATASIGGFVTSSGVQYLATGGLTQDMGRLISFRPKGTDTVPAMLTPGEGVVNRRGMSALGIGGLQSLNNGGSPSPVVNVDLAPLHSEISGLRSDLKRQSRALPQMVARAVADTQAKAS